MIDIIITIGKYIVGFAFIFLGSHGFVKFIVKVVSGLKTSTDDWQVSASFTLTAAVIIMILGVMAMISISPFRK